MSNTNTEYNFDESFLDQSIASEIQDAIIKRDDNKTNSVESNNNDQGLTDFDIDKAISQELNVGLESDSTSDDKLDSAIDELHKDATKSNESKNTNSTSDQENDIDPYQLALDVIREENLLYIPEDFEGELDADTIDYFKQQTDQIKYRQLLTEQRNKFADDPYKLRLFDYFFTADSDADLPTFNELNNGLEYWDNFDISNEDNQKAIIAEYLKDGLNPDNPSYNMLASDIDKKVEDMISAYEGEDKAKEAKDYFIEKHKRYMASELERVNREQQARLLEEQKLDEMRMKWNQDFANSVKNKEWSPSKKQKVLNEQYQEVLYGEEYAPVWYVKESIIKNNPELYVTYLDWLSTNFDLETMSFVKSNSSDSKQKSEVTRKIMDLINKKQGTNKSYQNNNNSKDYSDEEDLIVNPLDNI